MNKKYQQLVPIILIVSVLLAIIILYMIAKPKFEEFTEVIDDAEKNSQKRTKLEEQIKKADAEKRAQEIKLKELKPIYKSNISSDSESLGIYGDMFDNIIKIAQSNGLLIRSIEYDMNPVSDPLYAENSANYNACELKFFFVGTYSQMQSFLNDMNNNFEYFVSLSHLSITAFPENVDYLLINAAITLYSEKNASDLNKASKPAKK